MFIALVKHQTEYDFHDFPTFFVAIEKRFAIQKRKILSRCVRRKITRTEKKRKKNEKNTFPDNKHSKALKI